MLRSRIVFPVLAALMALGGAGAGAQTAPAPLAAFERAWAGVNGYHTDVHCYAVKGSDSENTSYDFTFTKPSSISMNVVSGPHAGNNVSWSGGNTVNAGRGMFRKNFNLNDPEVTSLRGNTVVDLSFGSILRHAQLTAGTVRAIATTFDGAPVDLVNLDTANPSADDGLTREALYLSTATNLPVRVDGFTGSQLITSCTFSGTTTT